MATITDTVIQQRLRCSISGGLEELAEQEAQQLGLTVHWSKRGHQGSRLELWLDQKKTSAQLINVLQQLHYVEYVYLEVRKVRISFDGTKETLLSQVADESAAISGDDFDQKLEIWQSVKEVLRDRQDVGLESLPGVLLQTPSINADEFKCETAPTTDDPEFVVNTVYTRPATAKAVVDTFLQLVNEYSALYAVSQQQQQQHSSTLYVDAGAGAGALLTHLPASQRVGIDLQPAHSEVQEMDYFQVTKPYLLEQAPNQPRDDDTTICVISNPPFAERSRGDYSGIVKFINHSFVQLQAMYVGVIVPSQFCRKRVWQSLGLDPCAKLLARFILPDDSFYDPASTTCRNISATFLFFGLNNTTEDIETMFVSPSNVEALSTLPTTFRVEGKRDKGDFPWLRTAEFVDAVVKGLSGRVKERVELFTVPEDLALSAELSAVDKTTALMELHILLNPKQPLSLINCMSCKIPEHSLGWLSMSVKPPIALAMCTLDTLQKKPLLSKQSACALAINTMCGEGTIELESRQMMAESPFFLIAGDKSEEAVRDTVKRLASLEKHTAPSSAHLRCTRLPLIDFVIWDAQRLPLRSGIVDLFVADLPFGGSQTKKHQEPTLSGKAVDTSLSYKHLMAGAVRVLRCGGQGSFVSADTKALSYAALRFNGRLAVAWRSNVNLGGLAGKLMLLEKSKQCTKDVSVWMKGHRDHSDIIRKLSTDACIGHWLNDVLELEEDVTRISNDESLIKNVELVSTFSKKNGMVSHCYRIRFDTRVSNGQAKSLEKIIRVHLSSDTSLLAGMQLK